MKVKDIEIQKGGGENSGESAKITIEEDGKEYVFSAQLQDVLDDAIFKNLCGVFKRAIKKKVAFNKISKQVKETKVKALKGKEIDV